MTMVYNKEAKKKNTNLSINSDLLQKAKDNNINLSSTLEKTLENQLRDKEIQKWQDSNKDAIESYNLAIEKRGLFGKNFGRF
ncbi:MAG: type II toxin-antitoxin system CcdA family antitoxin [Arcobacteraceae bacterium]